MSISLPASITGLGSNVTFTLADSTPHEPWDTPVNSKRIPPFSIAFSYSFDEAGVKVVSSEAAGEKIPGTFSLEPL